VAFNFEDISAQARQFHERMRAEAARIIDRARQEAGAVRKRAEQEGRQAALAAVEQMVEKQLSTVVPALRQAVREIDEAKRAWLAHWEAGAIHVAAAIARRLIRRELTVQPDIPLTLIREALELAVGAPRVRLHLSPADCQAIGSQAQMLAREMAGLGQLELVSDATVTAGGCRVETRFGTIDQQFEAQLARVEEELNA
jgi:flagellar assembly protein FliH